MNNKKILHLIRISEASFKETTGEIRPLLFVSIIPEKNAVTELGSFESRIK
jgi:hypothetical protein